MGFDFKRFVQYVAARRIQSSVRCYIIFTAYKCGRAAIQIQKAWGGFQCCTDFIFAKSDIVNTQRTVRQWLATRMFRALKMQTIRVNSCSVIQKTWRGYKPQIDLLFALGNIIISQSVVRRHFAIKACRPLICVRRIQSLWRGYDCRNFYLKKRLARHQAVVLIQKIVRGFLQYSRFVIIHFEYQTLREKKAALKLEKFFIWVRKEVERNFNRREKIKLVRREKLQKKKAMTDEALLESIWLKTVDNKYYESGVQIFNMVACSKSREKKIFGIRKNNDNKGNRSNSTCINRIYKDSSEVPRNNLLKNNGNMYS